MNGKVRISQRVRATRKFRGSKAFLAEVRRQCRLAHEADRCDNWQQYIPLPE